MNRCHFIGIGGIGMSGLARLLLKKKVPVSGSDVIHSPLLEKLEKQGAKVSIGHRIENIEEGATVIYSSGIKKDNPEYLAAIDKKCKMLHRSDLLKQLMDDYKTLAVAGTHGKTTTTSLLTAVLIDAGLDPSFAVGGVIPQFETNAEMGSGEYFVAEADESDGSFLKYHPYGAILTNIGLDHMDYFGAIETVLSAYKTFIGQVEDKRLFFWCGDDPRLSAMAPKGVSYGFNPGNDLTASEYRQEGWRSFFDVQFEGRRYNDVELALAGRHNVLNALAVFGLAMRLGIAEEAIRRAFRSFKGVLRRAENKGEASGVMVIDDYGHHPEEIVCTLRGIREAIEERRMIVVFQPHRYSRTRDCMKEFFFPFADELVLTDIYGAGEAPIEGITAEALAKELSSKSKQPVHLVERKSVVDFVADRVRPHDVVVTLGAGDITAAGREIIAKLEQKPAKKWRVGLIFGGRSGEHEISLRSARYIRDHLNPAYYDISFFGITKEGNWLQEPLKDQIALKGGKPLASLTELSECDVLIPILHGPFGEDGTIQGLFEMMGKPYVGCNQRAGAIAMDKVLTKEVMLLNGIATSPFVDFTEREWREDPIRIMGRIRQQLRFPVYAKPIHLGSSIGVTRVESLEELPAAINQAFFYDNKVVVENGIEGREIEFALFGNERLRVMAPGQIQKNVILHDYESKYGANALDLLFDLDIPQEVLEEGKFLAESAYRAIECTGLARVDFFLDAQNRWWFNEINPMPGFTPSSMYPQSIQASGLKGEEVIDRLIQLAFQRTRSQQSYAVVI